MHLNISVVCPCANANFVTIKFLLLTGCQKLYFFFSPLFFPAAQNIFFNPRRCSIKFYLLVLVSPTWIINPSSVIWNILFKNIYTYIQRFCFAESHTHTPTHTLAYDWVSSLHPVPPGPASTASSLSRVWRKNKYLKELLKHIPFLIRRCSNITTPNQMLNPLGNACVSFSVWGALSFKYFIRWIN